MRRRPDDPPERRDRPGADRLRGQRRAALAEVAAAEERRKQREQDRIAKATAEADAAEAALAAQQAVAGGEAGATPVGDS